MSPKKLGFQFSKDSDSLFQAILSLKNKKECENFFRDLCTLSELKSMTERWQIVKHLDEGLSYRKIAERTGASTATVTRVAFWIENGKGGYELALKTTSSNRHCEDKKSKGKHKKDAAISMTTR